MSAHHDCLLTLHVRDARLRQVQGEEASSGTWRWIKCKLGSNRYNIDLLHTLMSGMTAIGREPTSMPSIWALAPLSPRVSSCSSAPSHPRLCTACSGQWQAFSTFQATTQTLQGPQLRCRGHCCQNNP